jgi:hypothetical protein
MQRTDAKEVEASIRRHAMLYQVPQSNILYDADGVGSYLRSYLDGGKAFVNASKPINNENYRNLKTQCYYKLAEYVNGNKIRMAAKEWRKEITEELEQIKAVVPSEDGKLAITSKDDVKANIGRSPDFADMMAMRMFFEVKQKSKTTIGFWRNGMWCYEEMGS